MASGKRFSLFGPRCGNVFRLFCRSFAVSVARILRANSRSSSVQPACRNAAMRGTSPLRAFGSADSWSRLYQSGTRRWFRSSSPRLGDFLDARVDLLRIGHLRGADQVQHLGPGLHHVRRNSAGIGDGVMNARFSMMCSLRKFVPVVINVTASSALRPRCGELAAWAAILKPPRPEYWPAC